MRGLREKNLSHDNRRGLTLLEVVLSLAIFVGAMAVLSELVATGHRASLQSRLQTLAIIRAEAQMNEVIANPTLMVSAAAMPFTEDYNPAAIGQWIWSLDVQSWDQNSNLLQLQLTVMHLASNGTPNATYTLRRYVRDPQVLQDNITAAEEAAEAAAEAAGGTTN
jgi:general secretion pathway protein I